MGDPDRSAAEPLGRSLLVIAEDLEMGLDFGALAHEICVIDADDPASLPDELFESVVVQSPGDLDGLLSDARIRSAAGGVILIDARAGGQVVDAGWRAVDVIEGGREVCLVRVEPSPQDGSDELNLLLRATRQAAARGTAGRAASWTIRSRAISLQRAENPTAPRLPTAAPSKGVTASPASPASPASRAPSPRGPGRPHPRRTGWRRWLPEALAGSGPDFGRRMTLVVISAIVWISLGALLAGLTGTGWLAVALWVLAGLQLAQLAHAEITRRSLRILTIRSSTRS